MREYVVKVTDALVPDAFLRFEDEWSPEQEIVRCRDCRFSKKSVTPFKDCWCVLHDMGITNGDWYCADGERK